MTITAEVRPVLERFSADVGRVLPIVALWAHGSLALGDFQPGRSDLDLVALTSRGLTEAEKRDLQRVHEALASEEPLLASDEPLADKLHCTYVVEGLLGDVGRKHLTWAFGELYDRVVSPVTRRELYTGGLCLHGPAPAAVVPVVTDEELKDYIRDDLRDYWYPRTARTDLWLNDVWVDHGLLMFGRATVTLAEGRLITKREAFDVLARLGAPADVLRDIYQRRYAVAVAEPAPEDWRARRGYLARTYLNAGISRVLSENGGHDQH